MDSTSASGVHTTEDGTRYVGGSVRPDGSVRRTRKVKPGYVPQEDVPKYVPIGRRRVGEERGGVIPKASTNSEENRANSPQESVTRPIRPRQVLGENADRPIRRSVRPVLDGSNEEPSSESKTSRSRERTARPVRRTRPVLDDENKRPVRSVVADDEADALTKGISGLSLNNATTVTAEDDTTEAKVSSVEKKEASSKPLDEKDITPPGKKPNSDKKLPEPFDKNTLPNKNEVKPKQTEANESQDQTESSAPKQSSQKYIPPWKRK